MHAEIYRIVIVLWLAFGLIWAVQAMRSKQTVHRQSGRSRYVHIYIMTTAFVLMFTHDLRFSTLARPFVPHTHGILLAGLFLTLAGFLIAIWARNALGSNWSGAVSIKLDHRLITRGPYALTRHPIYTGMLLMAAGTALVIGETRCIAALALATIGLYLKSRLEERFMIEQFGARYLVYKKSVKALVPWLL